MVRVMSAPDDANTARPQPGAPSAPNPPGPGVSPELIAIAALARAGAESLFRTLGALAARAGGEPERPAPERPSPGVTPLDASRRALRAAGDRLLALSRDPRHQPRDEHVAFARILAELAPDEARILRFLLVAGPQPSLAVEPRSASSDGAEHLADGIDLIASMAGCVHPDRGQQYLANLERLGMLRAASDALPDPRRYALLEAQPEAIAARARSRRARTVHRSVRLTPFGREFCQVCFTDEESGAPGSGADAGTGTAATSTASDAPAGVDAAGTSSA